MTYLEYERLLQMYSYFMQHTMPSSNFGILSESALRSALARPINAAHYEGADGLRQAAFLYHGLVMGHGFTDGNKRIAFLALAWFLETNRLGEVVASMEVLTRFGLDAASGKFKVDEVETWLREHVRM